MNESRFSLGRFEATCFFVYAFAFQLKANLMHQQFATVPGNLCMGFHHSRITKMFGIRSNCKMFMQLIDYFCTFVYYESQAVGLAEVIYASEASLGIYASEASLGGPGGRASQTSKNRV